jgi:hypothetical protein
MMILLVDEIIFPSPQPSPTEGRGGSLLIASNEGFGGKNNSLPPPGERVGVRVRGYPESVFVLNDYMLSII